MTNRNWGPESDFYDAPYIPTPLEREEWGTLFLKPVEAHTLLVNNLGKLSTADAQALRFIADSEETEELDFLSLVQQSETR